MNTVMPYIETAYRGRVKMLQACFGGAPEPEPAKAKLTQASFKAMFSKRG